MTTDKNGDPRRKPRILITEGDFIAAERAIAELLAKRTAERDLLGDKSGPEALEIERAKIDPLTDQIFELYGDICASPPLNRHTAAIKLRLAVDPVLGLDES